MILLREQYYIDLIQPKYNILKVAGSSLGYKHTEESFAKFNEENHHLYGKTHSPSTIVKLSGKNNHMFERKGELHPMYGKSLSIETRALSRVAQRTAIFVFSLNGTLVNSFNSVNEAKKFFKYYHRTIKKLTDSRKIV